jgi:hypothetical protein
MMQVIFNSSRGSTASEAGLPLRRGRRVGAAGFLGQIIAGGGIGPRAAAAAELVVVSQKTSRSADGVTQDPRDWRS